MKIDGIMDDCNGDIRRNDSRLCLKIIHQFIIIFITSIYSFYFTSFFYFIYLL